MSTTEDDGVSVRYVEVPTVEWREVRVPKVQIVEVEKRVPKIEIVEVPKVVDVVETHHVTKEVEKIIEQEVVRHVPKHQVIQVPLEVVKEVPKVEIVTREEIVEVPGEIIELPRQVRVENRRTIPLYHDKQTPTVVAQVVRPTIRSVPEAQYVSAIDYDPVLMKVVVPIPKPVPSTLIFGGKVSDTHKYIQVSAPEYNGLIKGMNRHLAEEHVRELYITDYAGRPIPPVHENVIIVPPRGPVSGRPYPPPRPFLPPNVQDAVTNTRGLPSSEFNGSWLGMSHAALFGLDESAARYYKEHHAYFNTPNSSAERKRAKGPNPSHRF